jgi:autotransporter-associated beta strand protein
LRRRGTSLYGGTLTLGGTSNYTGTTTITRGIVKLGANNALPTGTTLTQSANPGSIFDLNGFNQTVAQIGGANQSTITNTSATPSPLTITTSSTITASSQVLTGNLNVTKTGTGAWLPAVAHTFTGVLTLAGGATTTSNNNQLGAIGQATILLDGMGTNTPYGVASTVAATWDRAIALAGTGGRITGSGVKAITLSGVISGSGDLRYGSATEGAIILAGNNTYSGLTKIENTGTELIAANDNAFGQSSVISQGGTSISGTIGFQRSLTNQNINIGSATDITFQANAHSSGLGSIHNFSGDNSFGGDIIMSGNTQLYAAESGSALLLKRVISGARPFTKRVTAARLRYLAPIPIPGRRQ